MQFTYIAYCLIILFAFYHNNTNLFMFQVMKDIFIFISVFINVGT